MLMATAIFEGLSSINTISAASIAASDPSAPIAMPISARESTGASLMPSPTNASFPRGDFSFKSASTRSTLSPGKSCACTSSIPSSLATLSPTAFASPVSITVLRTPRRFSSAIASAASGFSSSEITMWPTYSPSSDTCTVVPIRWHGCHGTPTSSISLSLPAQTVCPSITARTPRPDSSSTSDTRADSSSLPYASRREREIGWSE